MHAGGFRLLGLMLACAAGTATAAETPPKPAGAIARPEPAPEPVSTRESPASPPQVAARIPALLAPYELPVSQPLFGLPDSGKDPSVVVWCAPRRAADDADSGAAQWSPSCLAANDLEGSAATTAPA